MPVNKPETTAMLIVARYIARRFRMPHLAILRTADDTALAIADDLLRYDWLGRLYQ